MKPKLPVQLAVLVPLIAVYAAVRVDGLTQSCLWFDEIFSVHAAEHSWGSILSFVAMDLIHPPLFYLLLKIWTAFGGEGLLWLRTLPVIFAIASILPFLQICKELKLDLWTRGIAFLLFAVNGSLIKYAQEVRMYGLLLCLSLFSIWLFIRYFRKGKSLTALIIVNVLLVYAHYFGWLVVASEILAIVIFQRIKIRAILVMFGITLLSFLPWAIAVLMAARGGAEVGQNIGWMQRPGAIHILQVLFNLIEPFYFTASMSESITVLKVSAPLIGLVLAAFALGFTNQNKLDADRLEAVKLLAIFTILPLLLAFAASWLLPYSIWGMRHLIIVFAPAVLLVGIVVGRIELLPLKAAVATLLVLFCVYAFVLQINRDVPTYSWCAWEPLADEPVGKNASKLYVFEDIVAYHFWFALKGINGDRIDVVKIRNVPGVTEDPGYFLPRGFDGISRVDLASVTEPQVWVAYRGERIDESKPPLKPFIDNGYKVADRKVFAARGENAIILLLEK